MSKFSLQPCLLGWAAVIVRVTVAFIILEYLIYLVVHRRNRSLQLLHQIDLDLLIFHVTEGNSVRLANVSQLSGSKVTVLVLPDTRTSERRLESEAVHHVELSPHHHSPRAFFILLNVEVSVVE